MHSNAFNAASRRKNIPNVNRQRSLRHVRARRSCKFQGLIHTLKQFQEDRGWRGLEIITTDLVLEINGNRHYKGKHSVSITADLRLQEHRPESFPNHLRVVFYPQSEGPWAFFRQFCQDYNLPLAIFDEHLKSLLDLDDYLGMADRIERAIEEIPPFPARRSTEGQGFWINPFLDSRQRQSILRHYRAIAPNDLYQAYHRQLELMLAAHPSLAGVELRTRERELSSRIGPNVFLFDLPHRLAPAQTQSFLEALDLLLKEGRN